LPLYNPASTECSGCT